MEQVSSIRTTDGLTMIGPTELVAEVMHAFIAARVAAGSGVLVDSFSKELAEHAASWDREFPKQVTLDWSLPNP